MKVHYAQFDSAKSTFCRFLVLSSNFGWRKIHTLPFTVNTWAVRERERESKRESDEKEKKQKILFEKWGRYGYDVIDVACAEAFYFQWVRKSFKPQKMRNVSGGGGVKRNNRFIISIIHAKIHF